MAHISRRYLIGAAALGVSAAQTGRAYAELTAKHGFNDEAIDWHLLDEGIERATRENKPILLLAHTTWCPHCEKYKALFFNKSVLSALDPFVSCLVDRDEQPDLNADYSPDGEYVPRTMVLTSDGRHLQSVRGPYSRYKYFLPNDDADGLISFLGKGFAVASDPGAVADDGKSRFLKFLERLQGN